MIAAVLVESRSRLLEQIYPSVTESIFKPIRVNSTTRIVEMIAQYQKRILKHKNKKIFDRVHTITPNGMTTQKPQKPMRYTKVLCHACYEQICIHDLYLSKNGEHGRSKYYHVNCAAEKLII